MWVGMWMCACAYSNEDSRTTCEYCMGPKTPKPAAAPVATPVSPVVPPVASPAQRAPPSSLGFTELTPKKSTRRKTENLRRARREKEAKAELGPAEPKVEEAKADVWFHPAEEVKVDEVKNLLFAGLRKSYAGLKFSSFGQAAGPVDWYVDHMLMQEHDVECELIPETMFEEETRRICIVGKSGIGKSALCKFLASRWSNGSLWQDRFDVLLLLSASNLQKTIAQAACAFLPAENRNEGVLTQILNSTRTLIVIEDISSNLTELPNLLPNARFIFTMTSQASFMPCDKTIELLGLSVTGRQKLIKAVCHRQASAVLEVIRSRRNFQNIVKLPVIAELLSRSETKLTTARPLLKSDVILEICPENTAIENPDEESIVTAFYNKLANNVDRFMMTGNELLRSPMFVVLMCFCFEDGACESVTRLYQTAVDKLLDRRHAIALDEALERKTERKAEREALERKALERKGLEGKGLHEKKEKIEVDIEVPPSSSEFASISREFDHATFDCFFSASAIVACKDGKILLSLLKTLKYDRDCTMMWQFVAGLFYHRAVETKNFQPLIRFFHNLDVMPRDLIGVKHINLIIMCLNECEEATENQGEFSKEYQDVFDKLVVDIGEWVSKVDLSACLTLCPNVCAVLIRGQIDKFVPLLTDPDETVRRRGVRMAGVFRKSETFKALLEPRLADESELVRGTCIQALCKWESINEDFLLQMALHDKSCAVRNIAAEKLVRAGKAGPEVRDMLLKNLKSHLASARKFAAILLASFPKIGDTRAKLKDLICAPELNDACCNIEKQILAASSVFVQWQDAFVLPQLCTYLAFPHDGMREGAIAAIGSLGQVAKLKNQVVRQIECELSKTKGSQEALKRRQEAALRVLSVIGNLDPETIEIVTRYYNSAYPEIKMAAALALANSDCDKKKVACATLIEGLKACSKYMRTAVLSSLAKIGLPSNCDLQSLLDIMTHPSTTDHVVRACIQALRLLTDLNKEKSLVKLLRNSKIGPRVRDSALIELKFSQSAPSDEALKLMLLDVSNPNHFVRWAAVKAIAELTYRWPGLLCRLCNLGSHNDIAVQTVAYELCVVEDQYSCSNCVQIPRRSCLVYSVDRAVREWYEKQYPLGYMRELREMELSRLHLAAKIGDLKDVARFLPTIPVDDQKNPELQTPLMMAVKANKFEVVNYLIDEAHANLNYFDHEGKSVYTMTTNSDQLCQLVKSRVATSELQIDASVKSSDFRRLFEEDPKARMNKNDEKGNKSTTLGRMMLFFGLGVESIKLDQSGSINLSSGGFLDATLGVRAWLYFDWMIALKSGKLYNILRKELNILLEIILVEQLRSQEACRDALAENICRQIADLAVENEYVVPFSGQGHQMYVSFRKLETGLIGIRLDNRLVLENKFYEYYPVEVHNNISYIPLYQAGTTTAQGEALKDFVEKLVREEACEDVSFLFDSFDRKSFMAPVWIEEQREAKNCVSSGHWVGVVARHDVDVWKELSSHECSVLSQQNSDGDGTLVPSTDEDGTLVPSTSIGARLQEASKYCVYPAQFLSVTCQRCGLHAVSNAVAFVTGGKQSHIFESDEAESTASLERVLDSSFLENAVKTRVFFLEAIGKKFKCSGMALDNSWKAFRLLTMTPGRIGLVVGGPLLDHTGTHWIVIGLSCVEGRLTAEVMDPQNQKLTLFLKYANKLLKLASANVQKAQQESEERAKEKEGSVVPYETKMEKEIH